MMAYGRTTAVLLAVWMAVFLSSLGAVAQKREAAPPASGLEGEYRCAGRTEMLVNGKPELRDYVLKLTIAATGDVYDLLWTDQRGPTQKGFGFTRDGYLVAVMWSASGAVGIANYKVAPEGLLGLWTGGSGAVEREDCRKGWSTA